MDIPKYLIVITGFLLQSGSCQRPRSKSKCFKRNLEFGKHFYQVIDEPVGKTTNILRGSSKIYLGKINSNLAVTVIGPSAYNGSKGFVVQRVCIFTKNVVGIRMKVTGIPRKQGNGWVGGGQAFLRAKVKNSKRFKQTCLNPYQTPLIQLTLNMVREGKKGTRIQAQKLYIEACEKR